MAMKSSGDSRSYDALMRDADRLYENISPAQKDALFELVVYPVRAAALANRRYFSFEKAAEYLAQGRASAIEWAERGRQADLRMNLETDYYNQKLAGGKWRHMMAIEMPAGFGRASASPRLRRRRRWPAWSARGGRTGRGDRRKTGAFEA